jgi:hypothetical protein
MPWRHIGGVEVNLHPFLTMSAYGGGELQTRADLPLEKDPGTHLIGGWVGPRAGMDFCGIEENLLHLPGFVP